ncbi:MAG: IS200/IS605 family transposase [Planctomycetota bacterium]|nr:IS200/IS605 family transposase [Planctomycetota bacterium]
MSHTFSSLFTHFVFSTKERATFLDPELRPRLFSYLGGIAREQNATLVSANGAADHIHLLALLHPTIAPADFVRTLKAGSSRWIHETFSDLAGFAWQTGYGAFSVSKSNVETVVAYIRGQEEHHRKMTFKEELLALLRKHDLDYDERYLWD